MSELTKISIPTQRAARLFLANLALTQGLLSEHEFIHLSVTDRNYVFHITVAVESKLNREGNE